MFSQGKHQASNYEPCMETILDGQGVHAGRSAMCCSVPWEREREGGRGRQLTAHTVLHQLSTFQASLPQPYHQANEKVLHWAAATKNSMEFFQRSDAETRAVRQSGADKRLTDAPNRSSDGNRSSGLKAAPGTR